MSVVVDANILIAYGLADEPLHQQATGIKRGNFVVGDGEMLVEHSSPEMRWSLLSLSSNPRSVF
jgi:hypothetical protein